LEKTLTISLKNHAIFANDGFRYSLTKKFFNLYLLLALERIDLKSNNSGFVDVSYIAELVFWEKNTTLSIGKQISRHITEMEKLGRNIIECVQKVNGPFRLLLAPRQIILEENTNNLKSFLGLNNLQNVPMQQNEETFFSFVEKIWEGDIQFNEGNLNKAMIQFESASKEGNNSENVVSAMQRLGRVLERLGKYQKAESTYRKARKVIHSKRPFNYLLLAENNIYHGWLYLRQRKLNQAEKLFHKALDLLRGKAHNRLLGDIYNSFGKIRELNEKLDEALSFYQRALSLWVSINYFYGIQACYFNIGNLYKIWADKDLKLNKYQLNDYAREKYEKAIKWAKECDKICDRTGLGYDTSQALILISYSYFRLENFDKSLSNALTAKEFAEESKNIRDLAASCKRVGAAYWKKEDIEKGKKFLKDSIFYYKKLNDTKEVQKIKKKIKELNL